MYAIPPKLSGIVKSNISVWITSKVFFELTLAVPEQGLDQKKLAPLAVPKQRLGRGPHAFALAHP